MQGAASEAPLMLDDKTTDVLMANTGDYCSSLSLHPFEETVDSSAIISNGIRGEATFQLKMLEKGMYLRLFVHFSRLSP